jgi:hypothetical protein
LNSIKNPINIISYLIWNYDCLNSHNLAFIELLKILIKIFAQGFPGFAAPPQQYAHGPVLYSANGNTMPSPVAQTGSVGPVGTSGIIQTMKKELTPLVPYGPTPPKPLSRPSFIVPPADVQIIIDKMASYVAKNGRDFETIVKNKGDPRFSFLELSHQYHGYYAHKLTIYEGAVNPRVLTEEELLQKQELQQEKQKKLEELQKKQQRMEEVQKRVKMIQAKKKNEISSKQNTSKQITTVSFSIKKPKEGESSVIEKRSALPLEESDDEADEDKKEANSKPNSPEIAEEVYPVKVEKEQPMHQEKLVADKKVTRQSHTNEDEGTFVDLTDDIFEDCQKEIRDKQAEDKIRDKMVLVAREKLAASKEKQLQMERRKKAAVFLSQIQAPIVMKHKPTTTQKEELTLSFPSPTRDLEIEELRLNPNSLQIKINRLKETELNMKKSKQRSRSRSGSTSLSDKHRSHKKHKKKKSTHKRYEFKIVFMRSFNVYPPFSRSF